MIQTESAIPRATQAGVRVQVTFFGEVIADSREAIRLVETGVPVYYFPRCHVKMERLYRSTRREWRPSRGDASYFTLANGRMSENAVWSYEQPDGEWSVIQGRLAFDADKVDSIRVAVE